MKERWLGENRRSGDDRRKTNDPDYEGPERRNGQDRRVREKRSLLVVDSSATYLFYMGMLLKKLDYAVHTAMTGEDALKALNDASFDLVITDSALPRMSGINLLKQMKRAPRLKAIPVIFHTSDSDPSVRTACRVAGCADYLRKPVEPNALYRAIQAATETTPRQTIRIDTSLIAEIGDAAIPGGALRTETVTTISGGGLYIKTLVPEPVETVLPLTLFISNRKVRARAVVLHSSNKIGGEHKEPGMAMKFISISQEDKALVHDFIKEQVTRGISMPAQ